MIGTWNYFRGRSARGARRWAGLAGSPVVSDEQPILPSGCTSGNRAERYACSIKTTRRLTEVKMPCTSLSGMG